MLKIAALNEELSEESSGVEEPILPTKEVEVSNIYKSTYNCYKGKSIVKLNVTTNQIEMCLLFVYLLSQEADSLNLYKEALDLRQKNEFDAALKLFHHTLALPCIENVFLLFTILDYLDNFIKIFTF